MTEESITVVLADDNERTRVLLARALERGGLRVRTAATGADAEALLSDPKVSVLVADIQMPGNESLELVESEEVRRRHLSVILITGGASLQTATQAVKMRAFDYLTKPVNVDELLQRIRLADRYRRTQLLNDKILTAAKTLLRIEDADSGGPPRLYNLHRLSSREQQIAKLIVDGLKPEEISKKLHISPYTTRNHTHSMFAKLNVSSQSELVLRLLRG